MIGTVRTHFLIIIAVPAIFIVGCSSGPGVRRTSPSLLSAWQASAIKEEDLSLRTKQTLRQLNLTERLERKPHEAFETLHQLAVKSGKKDLMFALAEISYGFGRKLEKKKNCEAIAYYYLCAGYAYHFLFDEPAPSRPFMGVKLTSPPQLPTEVVFDPRFRLACDLYNNGLAKCIRAAQHVGRLDPRNELHLPTADGGKFTLSVTHHRFAWHPEEFGPLLFCSDYKVVGLQNHFRGYGLGVPLIGTRVAAENSAPGHAFYPKEVSFPVTAFFRFEGSVAELGDRRAGKLELYNPLEVRKIKVGNRTVPLETDLTTPLAYFLSRTDLEGVEISGFFRGEQIKDRTGIYMFEPYQPGKIPVLMVHGLLSSPLTWTSMFNDLRADPVLNSRYQFWFYLYPTGDPYLTTAADLRQKLNQLRMDLDPHRSDPALDRMVLVGHSMGGLIAKMMTQDSGDEFWHMVSHQPFSAVKADSQTRRQLQQVFFFERQPYVQRVIFLGTPHRGSKLSPSVIGRLVNKLIRVPEDVQSSLQEMIDKNPKLSKVPANEQQFRRIPTSVDLLRPGSPALELLSARSAPEGVQYHSIIGVYKGKGSDSHDGVVRFGSAHIDGVESEILVPSHHINIHHHPLSILEVRRVLHKHLDAVDAGQEIIPVFHKVDPNAKPY